jgi:uncharacterized protein (TIGR00369 family)
MRGFFGVSVPFLDLLGVRGERSQGGETELSLEVRPDLTNHFHGVHGGVVATMLDVAMASAARSLHPELPGVVTVGMTLNYLRAPDHGRLVARGKVRQAGRSLVFCEAQVLDEDGALVATAMGTFKRRRSAAGARTDGDV